MGLVRFLLALGVVLGHAGSSCNFVGGRNAVQMFYVISGFLMSYILVERQTYSCPSSFFANRLLRLYPIYFVVLLMAFLANSSHADSPFFATYLLAPPIADIILILSNLFIIGQDWVMFLGTESHSLHFTTNYRLSDVELWRGLLIPQAWTLGIELSFYLIAPFILTKRGALWLLLGASLLLRGVLIKAGLGMNDPWYYRFFPTELALFIIGALIHQILRPFYNRHRITERYVQLGRILTWVAASAIVSYPFLPGGEIGKSLALFALFLPTLPFLFDFQSRSWFDRKIGELSYPIYISHMVIISAFTSIGLQQRTNGGPIFTIAIAGTAIALAYLLNRCIGSPVEAIRNRFKMHH